MTQININFLLNGLPRCSDIFIVGGTVRDLILGKTPADYDIVTLGDPQPLAGRIAEICRSRVVVLGKPGMRLFRISSPEHMLDVVAANGDSIESDLQKRDFTINAMAISTADGTLVDIFNGLADIKAKIIRMVRRENLLSDPVRLLRAYRLGALLNFSIDRQTRSAVSTDAHRVSASAPERIRDEWMKLLASPQSFEYIKDMADIGLLTAFLPEMNPLKGCLQNQYHHDDVFTHSLNAYACLEDILNRPESVFPCEKKNLNFLPDSHNIPLLKYAILIHDIGKPQTRSVDTNGKVHFYRHEEKSAQLAEIINKRLRFANNDIHYIDGIIQNHLSPLLLFIEKQKDQLTSRAINRFFLRTRGFVNDLFIHAIADMRGKGGPPDAHDFIEFSISMMKSYLDTFMPLSVQRPIINGNDLINEFGLSPSPVFRKILNDVEEKRLLHLIHTRDEALTAVKNFLKSHQDS